MNLTREERANTVHEGFAGQNLLAHMLTNEVPPDGVPTAFEKSLDRGWRGKGAPLGEDKAPSMSLLSKSSAPFTLWMNAGFLYDARRIVIHSAPAIDSQSSAWSKEQWATAKALDLWSSGRWTQFTDEAARAFGERTERKRAAEAATTHAYTEVVATLERAPNATVFDRGALLGFVVLVDARRLKSGDPGAPTP